ncbi:MAG: hypothetical protein ACRDRZ_11350, partial [Pseudonocardiaceae bacterium]
MTTSREDNPSGVETGGPSGGGPAITGLRRSAEFASRAVRTAWRSDHLMRARSVAAYRARQALRDLGRLFWFAIRGHARWVSKAWTFFTHGDLRADARGARIAGDPEARRAAQELIRADARARWAKL